MARTKDEIEKELAAKRTKLQSLDNELSEALKSNPLNDIAWRLGLASHKGQMETVRQEIKVLEVELKTSRSKKAKSGKS